MTTQLQTYLFEARVRAGLTQQALATRLNTSKQWVSEVERGARLPSTRALQRLHDALVPASSPNRAESLLLWLTALAVRRSTAVVSDELRDELFKSFGRVAAALSPDVVISELASHAPLLDEFPRGFRNLVIVIGDRRETPPRSRADLLAHSLSASDLRFLPRLDLDTSVDIVSDKIFAMMDDAYLTKRFAKSNLLVIGSPAVNLAARRLTLDSVFHFDQSTEALAIDAQLRGLNELRDRRLLRAAWRLLRRPRLLAGKTLDREVLDRDEEIRPLTDDQLSKLLTLLRPMIEPLLTQIRSDSDVEHLDHLLDVFRKPGIIDPVAGRLRKIEPGESTDLALISVGPNPFAPPGDLAHVCVSVAGVHGPGTAQALRLLGDRANGWAQERPLGGVIEVGLDSFKDWPARFDEATSDWLTPRYTIPALHGAISRAFEPDHALHRRISQSCLDFVAAINGMVTGAADAADRSKSDSLGETHADTDRSQRLER